MSTPRRHWLACFALLIFSARPVAAPAQETAPGLVNGNFEEAGAEDQPLGWTFPSILATQGYHLSLDRSRPLEGKSAARLDATGAATNQNSFGNLMQSLDAAPYRGQRVRFRAAVRTGELEADGRAQLWFRVDRRPAAGGASQPAIGAFDNMQDRPIRDGEWKHYEIVGQVDDDATRIHVGLLVIGKGKAWIDDASLEVVADKTPVTGQALAAVAGAAEDPPQSFFSPWLALALVAIALFALSQTQPSAAQRFALRFSFIYWLLYSLPAPLVSVLPVAGFHISQWHEFVVDKAVRWTAAETLGIERTLVAPNGSGDTTFDYVRLLLCFAIALIVAAIWSVIDRRKVELRLLSDLLRSFLRYVLAFTLLGYGMAKLGSTYNQFPAPEVDQLFKTYGDSSPMNLVWTFMGASRAYTMFSGLGEVFAGLLLVWRRTTLLGALLGAGVMLNVVMLNFCYDVPVKQYSSHLLAMAIYIMLPDAARLANVLFFNRPAPPADLKPVWIGPKSVWVFRAVKTLILITGVGLPLYGSAMQEYRSRQTPVAEPAFFGSYEVESFRRDGEETPPLLTDSARWRTVAIRRLPDFGEGPRDLLIVRMMDSTAAAGQVKLSGDERTLSVSGGTLLPAQLTVEPIDDRHLAATGEVGGHSLEIRLKKLSREDFLLVRRGFRWINEYPYNR